MKKIFDDEPWVHQVKEDIVNHNKRVWETLKDYKKCTIKCGDIIRFRDGMRRRFMVEKRWEYWFLKGEEREEFLKRERVFEGSPIPKYARCQYGIILARYKSYTERCYVNYRQVVKQMRNFIDYGSIIMMLTGSRIGHIRRYHMVRPYELIDSFPYKKKNMKSFSTLFQEVEVGGDVSTFLKRLTEKLNGAK